MLYKAQYNTLISKKLTTAIYWKRKLSYFFIFLLNVKRQINFGYPLTNAKYRLFLLLSMLCVGFV